MTRGRLQPALLFAALAALALLGTVGALSLPDPRYVTAVSAYAAALLVGVGVGVLRMTWAPLAALTVAVIVAPRMIFTATYPVTLGETNNGKYLAVLCAIVLGAALVTATSRRERFLIVAPALLMAAGVVLYPLLLLDFSTGWLASGGAIFVLATKWLRFRTLALLAALAAGVISIHWNLPGIGASIGVLPSSERPFGFFGNPLVGADALWLLASALIVLLWRHKLLVLVVVAVTVASIVETGSRTGLVLAAFTLGAMVLGFYPRITRARLADHRLLAAAVVAALGGVAFWAMHSSLGRFGELSPVDSPVGARLVGVRQGFAAMLASPFGGSGANIDFSGQATLHTYENMFFDVGSKLGWMPLLALVVTFAVAWRLSNAPGRTVLAVAIIAGCTMSLYYHPAGYVTALVCAGVATGEAQRRASAEVAEPLVTDERVEDLHRHASLA